MSADWVREDRQDHLGVLGLDAVESGHQRGQAIAPDEADLSTQFLAIIESLGPEVVDVGIANDDPGLPEDIFLYYYSQSKLIK